MTRESYFFISPIWFYFSQEIYLFISVSFQETSIFKTPSKELLQDQNLPELKSIKIIDPETSACTSRSPSCSGSIDENAKTEEPTTEHKNETTSSSNNVPSGDSVDDKINTNDDLDDVSPNENVETKEGECNKVWDDRKIVEYWLC